MKERKYLFSKSVPTHKNPLARRGERIGYVSLYAHHVTIMILKKWLVYNLNCLSAAIQAITHTFIF
jgi:hypothetical protein